MTHDLGGGISSGLPAHVNQSIEMVGTIWIPARHLLLQVVERDNVNQSIHVESN